MGTVHPDKATVTKDPTVSQFCPMENFLMRTYRVHHALYPVCGEVVLRHYTMAGGGRTGLVDMFGAVTGHKSSTKVSRPVKQVVRNGKNLSKKERISARKVGHKAKRR